MGAEQAEAHGGRGHAAEGEVEIEALGVLERGLHGAEDGAEEGRVVALKRASPDPAVEIHHLRFREHAGRGGDEGAALSPATAVGHMAGEEGVAERVVGLNLRGIEVRGAQERERAQPRLPEDLLEEGADRGRGGDLAELGRGLEPAGGRSPGRKGRVAELEQEERAHQKRQ